MSTTDQSGPTAAERAERIAALVVDADTCTRIWQAAPGDAVAAIEAAAALRALADAVLWDGLAKAVEAIPPYRRIDHQPTPEA